MKTPEELKKGLEYCRSMHELSVNCHSCPYDGERLCGDVMLEDAIEYIEWLEKNLQYTFDAAEVLRAEGAKFERERDAAVRDVAEYAQHGSVCRLFYDCPHGNDCPLYPSTCEDYEWRGVCPENTEVHDENA